jgi:hypothetical protein
VQTKGQPRQRVCETTCLDIVGLTGWLAEGAHARNVLKPGTCWVWKRVRVLCDARQVRFMHMVGANLRGWSQDWTPSNEEERDKSKRMTKGM